MKKKNTVIITALSLFVFGVFTAHANSSIQKETFIYSIKGTDTLRLDKYEIPDGEIKPCVIFAFGGGFTSGARNKETYIPYYNFLVEQGFSVIAIDYRLYLKGYKADKKLKAKDFIALFKKTIFVAVEDLFDATSYVLDNAKEWNIDKNMIVTSGSSAGAITVLQGEYERCNRTEIAERLPADFKYAGVIAFAGAIFSDHGHLKWKDTPAPVQFFHGDADKNVPFGKIKIFKVGFFGSEYIAGKYSKNKFPYFFYTPQFMVEVY